jgi:hypothetical protein
MRKIASQMRVDEIGAQPQNGLQKTPSLLHFSISNFSAKLQR